MSADNGDGRGTILGIWAHPDDETWLSAGLMARAVAAGRRVVCVTATKGEAGFPDDDTRTLDERTAIRESELAASLGALGVTEHQWLDYPDGGCATIDDHEAAAKVLALIEEVRPDVLFTFGPDGGTGHGDHVAACRWSTMAVQMLTEQADRDAELQVPALLYATRLREWGEEFYAGIDPATVMMIEDFVPEAVEPEELAVWFRCDDELVDRKVTALRAQVSQIESLYQAMGPGLFREFNRDECFREPRDGDEEILAHATAYSRGVR